MKPTLCSKTEKRRVVPTDPALDTQNVTFGRRRCAQTSLRADVDAPARRCELDSGVRRVQKNACHCRKTSVAFCALFCGMPLPLRTPRRNCVNWIGEYSY